VGKKGKQMRGASHIKERLLSLQRGVCRGKRGNRNKIHKGRYTIPWREHVTSKGKNTLKGKKPKNLCRPSMGKKRAAGAIGATVEIRSGGEIKIYEKRRKLSKPSTVGLRGRKERTSKFSFSKRKGGKKKERSTSSNGASCS